MYSCPLANHLECQLGSKQDKVITFTEISTEAYLAPDKTQIYFSNLKYFVIHITPQCCGILESDWSEGVD